MKRFKNILYVTETAVDQSLAIARAVSLAESNNARLTVIDVIPVASDDQRAQAKANHLKALDNLVGPHRYRMRIELDVLEGGDSLEISNAVLHSSYDLVIKAAENPGFMKRLFGSRDRQLLRKCPCPVWLMKSPVNPHYKCIVVAVDFDPLKPDKEEEELNRKILELAGSLALSDSTSLHLVHAWGAFAEETIRGRSESPANKVTAYIEKEYLAHQKQLFRLSETLRRLLGDDSYNVLKPGLHLLKGPAQKAIPAAVRNLQADLVVIGTVARTGVSGFLIGNTAEEILDHLACSVLAVKPANSLQ